MGVTVQVGSVSFERQPIADHAINLASTIQNNLKRSLEAIGVVRPAAPVQVVRQLLRGSQNRSITDILPSSW